MKFKKILVYIRFGKFVIQKKFVVVGLRLRRNNFNIIIIYGLLLVTVIWCELGCSFELRAVTIFPSKKSHNPLIFSLIILVLTFGGFSSKDVSELDIGSVAVFGSISTFFSARGFFSTFSAACNGFAFSLLSGFLFKDWLVDFSILRLSSKNTTLLPGQFLIISNLSS